MNRLLKPVYRAESIKVAEGQGYREFATDINIAFMNELAIIFNKMELILKLFWKPPNQVEFLNFFPGRRRAPYWN